MAKNYGVKRMRAKKIEWRNEYDGLYPFCPYCHEFAYERDSCVFCGKKYVWVDNKAAEGIEVKHKGFTAVQGASKGIYIFDSDGNFALHASCNEKLSEDELARMVDGLIELRRKKES